MPYLGVRHEICGRNDLCVGDYLAYTSIGYIGSVMWNVMAAALDCSSRSYIATTGRSTSEISTSGLFHDSDNTLYYTLLLGCWIHGQTHE